MRFGKTVVVCGVIAAVAFAAMSPVEAQVRRRSPVARTPVAQRGTQPAAQTDQKRELVTGTVVQLSPVVAPAVGPSGAQGVGSIFYNDVDTSLNSGNLVVTGLPAGSYYVWLVFFDPLTQQSQKIYSELVAKFDVPQNGARAETALVMGAPNVINISNAKQLVVTNKVKTNAEVGRKPVSGAAGYANGPAKGQAVLAANIN